MLTIAGKSFCPRLLPTMLAAIMFLVLMGLGSWQVHRLHWKEGVLADIDKNLQQPPMDIAEMSGDGSINYHPAKATGTLRNDKAFYLFSTSLTGEGGYHVLTPMELTNGRSLLVDRGWIPYGNKKDGGYFVPAGQVSVSGILRSPENSWLQPKNDPANNNWYGVDLTEMAKSAGVPFFLPYVLEADATPNAGGFPVGGQTRVTMPNNHFVYAVIWFGLALALLVVYFVSSVEKKQH